MVTTGFAAPATTGARSNFAEFRRQMKLKQKAAAADADDDNVTSVERSSPRRATVRSPSLPSPVQQPTDSGMLSCIAVKFYVLYSSGIVGDIPG